MPHPPPPWQHVKSAFVSCCFSHHVGSGKFPHDPHAIANVWGGDVLLCVVAAAQPKSADGAGGTPGPSQVAAAAADAGGDVEMLDMTQTQVCSIPMR